MRKKNRPRIGLALGAGAARGCAHIGVLDAIQEDGMDIEFIAGTSIGSLVGGVYASRMLEELRSSLLQLDWKEILYYFFDISIPRGGLIDGKRVVEFISQYVHHCDIRDLEIPFRAVATDVLTGEEVILVQGPLIEAIRASIALPGVFTPVPRGEEVLVDGGLVNPVPVSVVRDMGADFIIAVDINANRVEKRRPPAAPLPVEAGAKAEAVPPPDDVRTRLAAAWRAKKGEIDQKVRAQMQRWTRSDASPNIFDVLGNTIRIMEAQISETLLRVNRPDILIRPRVGYVSFLEFNKAEEMIEEGYRAAREALDAARDDGRL